MVDNGRFARNIQAFSIPVETIPEGVIPHDTTWVKSPHGAYVLVRTRLPLNYQGDMQDVPGYAVMFSQHPAFLADLFLRKGKEGVERPSKEEIEAKLTVVSARYEHDIIQTNPKTDEKHIVTAWMKTSIDRHTATTTRLLKRHGAAIKEGDSLYRSGSSIIRIKPTKKDPTKFECLYYGNPVFGTVSLFMNETMLESFWSRAFFRSSAIKLDSPPLTEEEAHRFAHEEFARISRGIMRLEDPYDLDSSVSFIKKIPRILKKEIVRNVQRVVHSVANMNVKALFFAASFSGILMFALQAPALLFAASAGKSNLLFKGAQTVARAGAKFLSPVSTLTVNALNDVATLVASQVKNNYVTDEVRGLIANEHYVDHMYAVPCQFMSNTYPEMLSYNEDHELEWARSVVLDTLGYQPGTFFSEIKIDGRNFLEAKQSNGLRVLYDPEELVAFMHKVAEPFRFSCLEKPIQKLLDTLTPRKNFIGVKLGKNGKVAQINFQSIKRIPKVFKPTKSNSIQALKAAGLDIDMLDSATHFPLVDILPKREAKKLVKASNKYFTNYLKTAFDEGITFHSEGEKPRTLNDNVGICMANKDILLQRKATFVYDFTKLTQSAGLRDSVRFPLIEMPPIKTPYLYTL